MPSQLPAAGSEAVYENSDADDLEDGRRPFRNKKHHHHHHRQQQQGQGRSDSASSKNVRRWKVTDLFSSPPR